LPNIAVLQTPSIGFKKKYISTGVQPVEERREIFLADISQVPGRD
jgi:hypothetical protein